ncbi:MAG: LysR family transcriptional regulator [Pseudomonadales bacterium]|nr:LysR family transcriptional regulator [Pseudomonadales bacterium]
MADLNGMVVFSKVVEVSSFTAAAGLLDMPKSSVSRKISELEERLGVQLLYRTSRSVQLTEIGAEYYSHCSRIAEAVEVADHIVTQRQLVPQGKLVISTPVPSGNYLFDIVFGSFLERYPLVEMELRIDSGDGSSLETDVDLAIRNGPLPDSDLIARPIGVVKYFLCATPEYIERFGIPRSVEDLKNHQLIKDASDTNSAVLEFWKDDESIPLAIRGRLTMPSPVQTHQATAAHMGISKLPVYLCGKSIRQGKLVSVLPEYQFAHKIMYLVYRSSRIQPIKLRLLIDHVAKAFNQDAPWDRE